MEGRRGAYSLSAGLAAVSAAARKGGSGKRTSLKARRDCVVPSVGHSENSLPHCPCFHPSFVVKIHLPGQVFAVQVRSFRVYSLGQGC